MSFAGSQGSIDQGDFGFLPQAKTIIIGDSSVGKSSIIWKYIQNDFKLGMPSTIGLDCNTKTIKLDDKNELKLLIWDTAGQEKYRSLITHYFKDAHGALLVFDLTVKESFEGVKNIWFETLKKHAPENVCKVALANKCDRIDEIEVSDEEIAQFEKKFNLKCFKTSAKENTGIEESFLFLAKQMKETFRFMTSIEIKIEHPLSFEKQKGIKVEKEKCSDKSQCC